MTIKIQLLHPNAKLPAKAHPDDACFDVWATSCEVRDGYIEYGLGFATEIPAGWEGVFRPRSSISKYDLALCNSVATIDAGYRGEWKARFKPTNKAFEVNGFTELFAAYASKPRAYSVGERIGQIAFQRVPEVSFEVVESLDHSARGAGGFGSTS